MLQCKITIRWIPESDWIPEHSNELNALGIIINCPLVKGISNETC